MKNFLFLCAFLFLIISCGEQKNKKTVFKNLNPEQTGIHFSNNIIENDTMNYTTFPYMYMGGGISIGDINNDGLEDVFFTGNMTSNKLYLNKGNLQFEDISESSGTKGDNSWYTGTTMVDINNDGWLDIYVCVSGKSTPAKNQLFINNKDNTFTEMAALYGLDDSMTSIQSTFFDYDNDGDLDVFVANYPIVPVTMGNKYYKAKMLENKPEQSGHLYRNDGHKTFTDVTRKAGVQNFGLTLGLIASDINNDGWQDLYLSNDFNVPDYFYLNNGDVIIPTDEELTDNSDLPENGHHTKWIEACKAGYNSDAHKALTSSFNFSGPLTESILMGNLAIRSYNLRNETKNNRFE